MISYFKLSYLQLDKHMYMLLKLETAYTAYSRSHMSPHLISSACIMLLFVLPHHSSHCRKGQNLNTICQTMCIITLIINTTSTTTITTPQKSREPPSLTYRISTSQSSSCTSHTLTGCQGGPYRPPTRPLTSPRPPS